MSDSSIGSFILGFAGAAVGNFLLPGIGGMIGFSLGSSVGAALFAPDLAPVVGPRLNDLSVTGSSYGTPIPLVYGTTRVACNMIWSAGVTETRHDEEVGGKGAPSQTVTSFTYSMSAAYAICEGEITGVRRIWLNSDLFYDAGDTSDPANLANWIDRVDGISIFLGTETQTPSSVIEAVEGVGNVSGHRGLAYIVFDTLQLAEYGNSSAINVEVEVVKTGTPTDPPILISDFAGTDHVRTNGTISQGALIQYMSPSSISFNTTPPPEYYGFEWELRSLDGTLLKTINYSCWIGWANVDGDNIDPMWLYGCKNDPRYVAMGFNDSSGDRRSCISFWGQIYGTYPEISHALGGLGDRAFGTGAIQFIRVGNKMVLCPYTPDGIGVYSITDTGKVAQSPSAAINLTTRWGAAPGAFTALYPMIIDNDDEHFFVINGDHTEWLSYWNIDGTFIASWKHPGTYPGVNNMPITPTTGVGVFRKGITEDDADTMYFMGKYSDVNVKLYSFDPTTTDSWWTLVNTVSEGTAALNIVPVGYGLGLSFEGLWTMDPLLPQAAEPLDDVVSDLCLKTGLVAGDIDVTALSSDNVRGYAVGGYSTARAAIDPLRTGFFFDAGLIDNKIEFIPRGGASAKTIADDDMAATRYGENLSDLLTVIRTGEKELPKRLTVSYINQGSNYLPGEQHAERITRPTTEIVNSQIPIVMTDDDAIRLADSLLYASYAEREEITFYVSTKYAEITPGDVVTVGSDAIRVRVTSTSSHFVGVIRITGVVDYSAAYVSGRLGAPSLTYSVTSYSRPGATLPVFIDSPILRTADDYPGYYMAGAGVLPSWNGAQIYISRDGGGTYDVIGGILNESTMGHATDALADHDSHTWDRVNTVNISFWNGTPSSTTELAVLNKANAAAIGRDGAWEIIQFTTATLEGDGTYTLSGLLRGRKGTEHNTGGHIAGDNFVMLSTSTSERIQVESADINVERQYKVISIGEQIQVEPPYVRTNAGEALKPLSPAWIESSRDGSNNLTVTWLRRSRYDYSAVYSIPLGEDSEEYEVEFYDGATLLRTYTGLTSETATYSDTDQQADASPVPATYTVKVYQISAAIGRGRAGEATTV